MDFHLIFCISHQIHLNLDLNKNLRYQTLTIILNDLKNFNRVFNPQDQYHLFEVLRVSFYDSNFFYIKKIF